MVEAQRRAEARQVFATLEALTFDDARALELLLSSGSATFQVHVASKCGGLVHMGLITPMRIIDRNMWLCKLHPALEKRRGELARHFRQRLDGARNDQA